MLQRFFDLVKSTKLYSLFIGGLGTSPDYSSYAYIPPDITFEHLRKNYQLRTSNFEYYKKMHEDRNRRLLHWIGSINYSGYVRQRSLQWLISNYQPGDEDRILLRLEDWVPGVAELAENWTKSHVPHFTLEGWVKNQKLLLYLIRKPRLRNSDVLKDVTKALLEKFIANNFKDFFSVETTLRDFIYRTGIADFPRLRGWILEDPTPYIRCQLLNLISFQELTTEEKAALQSDTSYQVKRRYIEKCAAAGDILEKEILKTLIFSSSKAMRDIARFYLKRDYQIDSYALYTTASGYRRYLVADFFRKEDEALLLEGATSSKRYIRYCCINALCTIDPQLLHKLDIKTLLVDNRKIRNRVIKALPHCYSITDVKRIKKVIASASTKGNLVYLNLIAKYSIWDFLEEGFLELCSNPTEEIELLIRSKVESNTAITKKLTPVQRHSIIDKVDFYSKPINRFFNETLDEIRFIVTSAV